MQESPYLKGQEHLIDKFKKLQIFESVGDDFLHMILGVSKIRRYEAGEVITHEGVSDSWVYILISGKVRVLKRLEEIAVLDRVGDSFGELSVIDGESRSATVNAIEPVVCLSVDSSMLDKMTNKDRNAFYAVIYRMFAEVIANKLRSTSNELALVKEELEFLKSRKVKG